LNVILQMPELDTLPDKLSIDNDHQLVEEFINGSELSFNKLAKKYQKKIYWHARRMTGNHLDADEIVQEVFLVMYNKLKDFHFKSSLYTWIYTITSTRSLNYIKRRKLKELFSFEDRIDEMKKDEDIISSIEDREAFKQIENMLQKLPPKQREVFILKSFDDLSYEEISGITGKSVGGLKANYFHAVQKLMKLLKKD
jgi:RNA polymerase sigma-70 factor, ECF subfamily